MTFETKLEGTDNGALRDLRDSIKGLNDTLVIQSKKTQNLSYSMLALTVVSTCLALSQLDELIELFLRIKELV